MPIGTVEASISWASGACSPVRTTTGRVWAGARSRSRPSCQARRPPRRRTTTRSTPSSSPGRSSRGRRDGFANRYGTGPSAARALSRSVSDVDSSRIMRRQAFLGVSAPRAVRTAGVPDSPGGFALQGSQWRDRAGFAPGFLPAGHVAPPLVILGGDLPDREWGWPAPGRPPGGPAPAPAPPRAPAPRSAESARAPLLRGGSGW